MKVLGLLQIATTALHETEVVSYSLIHRVVNDLLKNHLQADENDFRVVKSFKQVVTQQSLNRFDVEVAIDE